MKPGRERVKAWLYTVVNPLLDGLEIEASFLAKRNWTFRHHNRDLEFIRSALAIVGYRSRPNLEDCTASNPSAKLKINDRELRRQELSKACSLALDSLVNHQGFDLRLQEILRTFRAESPDKAEGLFIKTNPAEVIGELLVNNVEELPEHYGLHEFWLKFGKELLPQWAWATTQSNRAGARLKSSNDDLSLELSKLRAALAEQYDIPWAPYSDESMSISGR